MIIGAGPAGARAAWHLARAGWRVLLLEAGTADRVKLCGGLLHPLAQRELDCSLPASVLRLQDKPPLEYHDLDNRVRWRLQPGYAIIHRGAFDAWLREAAAAAGAELRCGWRVHSLRQFDGGHELDTSCGPVRAGCVIDASGWRALTRRLLCGEAWGAHGRPLVAVQGRITADLPPDAMWALYHSRATRFYAWLIPQGRGEFLLGAGFFTGTPGVSATHPAAPAAWALLTPFLAHLQERSARVTITGGKPQGCPITIIRGLRELWWGREGVYPIGEAAGLVSPASGGGIHYALAHARALATALLETGPTRRGTAQARPTRQQCAAVALRSRELLAPQLARLRWSCLKAGIAARPAQRAVAAQLLPLLQQGPAVRIGWQ